MCQIFECHLQETDQVSPMFPVWSPKVNPGSDWLIWWVPLCIQIPMMDVVAEMMVWANASVAERISKAFPGAALLRSHPPPRGESLEMVRRKLTSLEIAQTVTFNTHLLNIKQSSCHTGDVSKCSHQHVTFLQLLPDMVWRWDRRRDLCIQIINQSIINQSILFWAVSVLALLPASMNIAVRHIVFSTCRPSPVIHLENCSEMCSSPPTSGAQTPHICTSCVDESWVLRQSCQNLFALADTRLIYSWWGAFG